MSSQHFIGIDLGTVSSCLAYADDKGTVNISKNDGGSGLLPSVILFTDEGKYIGDQAVKRSTQYSVSNSVFFFKRMMGTDYKRTFGDESYNSSEMSAMILKKLMKSYEENTGDTVDTAVITVPGDFSDAEKNATVAAAKMAGIEKLELLNESIAAAISYRHFSKDDRDKKIIVYDLGGGTLDVTVVSIQGKSFNVLSDESSKDLGGRDWDLQLANIIQRKVLDSSGLKPNDVVSDSEFRIAVMAEAERQKLSLERGSRSVGSVKVKGKNVRYILTRGEFEDATTWLMMKTINMVGYALRNAHLTMSNIDSIVLVGGSTMMPQVHKSLKEAFPSVDLVSFDPEHAVARGAALYASSIFSKNDISVTSATTRTIGILAGIDGMEKICNVIFRNSPLPIDKTVMCRPKRDDQKTLEISIYESLARETDEFIEVSEGKLLANNIFSLRGKVTRGKTKIPIRFIADKDGRISVAIQCNGSFSECRMCDPMPSAEQIEESSRKLEGIL